MRLEITRRADLAVRAMRALGATTDRMKAPALADALCTTQSFVPQIVGPLVKAGWVRSDPGPTGGYALQVPLDEVSVLAVIEVIDGPTDAGICVVAGDPCDPDRPCVLHDAWTHARGELVATLDAMALSSIDTHPTR